MRDSKSKLWLVLTIILGVITTFLVARYLAGIKRSAAVQPMTTVVVAAKKIPQGTRLTQDMVKTIQVPVKYAHAKAANGVEKVVKQFSTVELLEDQVILTDQLATDKTGNELPYRIPDGTRAITVAVNPPSGVAGHIKPGHYVDVLMTYKYKKPKDDKHGEKEEPGMEDTRVITLLQKILVLAVGADLQKKEGAQPAENVTLAITPQDAELVALGENIGKLKLILRPTVEEKNNALKAVDAKGLQAQFP